MVPSKAIYNLLARKLDKDFAKPGLAERYQTATMSRTASPIRGGSNQKLVAAYGSAISCIRGLGRDMTYGAYGMQPYAALAWVLCTSVWVCSSSWH